MFHESVVSLVPNVTPPCDKDRSGAMYTHPPETRERGRILQSLNATSQGYLILPAHILFSPIFLTFSFPPHYFPYTNCLYVFQAPSHFSIVWEKIGFFLVQFCTITGLFVILPFSTFLSESGRVVYFQIAFVSYTKMCSKSNLVVIPVNPLTAYPLPFLFIISGVLVNFRPMQ